MRLPRRNTEPIIVLGKTGIIPRVSQLRVKESDMSRHLHIVGEPGSGKSKMLESMVLQYIQSGRGVGVLDPHSVLVDDILRSLIDQEVHLQPDFYERVIYVDPGREDYSIPFNALDTDGSVYDRAVAVLEAFRRTWSSSLKEAPQFTNIALAGLITLIENKLTLVDMPRLLTDHRFREDCLHQVSNPAVIEFFHDRYDRWGREAPIMRESTLNKVGVLAINDRLHRMLGQQSNKLNLRKIMDENKILLVDLGRCDAETASLIGNLIVTGFELAMRKRQTKHQWNLIIDEFAGYVANEGSVTTFANVMGEARKYNLALTVSHQNALAQLPPKILGALRTAQKVIFAVNRMDAQYFAQLIGSVNPEATKSFKNDGRSHKQFMSVQDQWETWTDRLRFQNPQRAIYAGADNRVVSFKTMHINSSDGSLEELDTIKEVNAIRHGKHIEASIQSPVAYSRNAKVPESEPV